MSSPNADASPSVTGEVPPEVSGILDGIAEPALLLAPDYRILAANRAYRTRYGEGGAVSGRFCFEVSHHIQHPCYREGEPCPMRLARESGEPQRVLHIHHTPDGEEHVEVEGRPIFDAGGKLRYLVEVVRQTRTASPKPEASGLVGRAPAFLKMLALVQRAAPSETPVLLLGESGTGKELVARAIHDQSRRAEAAFVPVECSGLTESLFESELFGHQRGAFTGAHASKEGLVEAARGGTLFLDEIGDVPLGLQVKLLRLLETGTYRRVGSVEPRQADFRLVSATHRDLRAMVEEGTFRRDLYYRISVFPIHLPALKERMEDLPLLAETLLRRIRGAGDKRLSRQALEWLQRHAFPGNVRELRNILERAALLADGNWILPEHLPEELGGGDLLLTAPTMLDGDEILPLDRLEKVYLARVAARFRGDRKELARRLGISERTLFRKLQRLQEEEARESGGSA